MESRVRKHWKHVIIVFCFLLLIASGVFGFFVVRNERVFSDQQIEELHQSMLEQQTRVTQLETERDEKARQEEQSRIESEKKEVKQNQEDEQNRIESEKKRTEQNRIDNISNCKSRQNDCVERIKSEKDNVKEQEKNYEEAKERYEETKNDLMKIDMRGMTKKTLDEAEKSLKEVMKRCEGYKNPCR